jgi:rare lipoprotein A
MRNLLPALLLLCAAVCSAAEEGLASWYGGKFQGRATASGEIYDAAQMTAAHKSLPFGTLVRVTNLENDREVLVRINDRGPFVAGRIIDLSRAAALALGMAGSGVARVRVEPLEEYAPRNFYILQFGAFRDEANARALAARLEALSVHAVLERPGGGIVRVVLADVPEEELEGLKASLAARGVKGYLIRYQRSELPEPPLLEPGTGGRSPETEPPPATAGSGS